MHWNYRLFKQDPHTVKLKNGSEMKGEDFYFVGECYYDEKGKPELHSTIDHNMVSGADPKEVREAYERVSEAFKAPIIELDKDGKFKKKDA